MPVHQCCAVPWIAFFSKELTITSNLHLTNICLLSCFSTCKVCFLEDVNTLLAETSCLSALRLQKVYNSNTCPPNEEGSLHKCTNHCMVFVSKESQNHRISQDRRDQQGSLRPIAGSTQKHPNFKPYV